MNTRQKIGSSFRWVVKIGSALLTNEGRGLDKISIKHWVAQMATLRKRGIEVVLVSSGSIAEGMKRLQWPTRPMELHKLQAAAAVGQMGMIRVYEAYFHSHGIHTAQILLTHEDLSHRNRYLNARTTLKTLISLGVVPIINENDTVAVDEIRFGDNDSLAGLIANLIEADLLVILTDQQGLYDSDPRKNPNASLISEAEAGDPKLNDMAGGAGGILGRGGMVTKLRAANLAQRSGTATWIASGRLPDVISRIAEGENIGTLLVPNQAPMAARKQWLASHLQMRGRLYLDAGAVNVLCHKGSSLLPVGVTSAEGRFLRGEMVACFDESGGEVARGLINYNFDETQKILGHSTHDIPDLLGYMGEPELIHRDNLVLV
jgi:glutamate 5-kinase